MCFYLFLGIVHYIGYIIIFIVFVVTCLLLRVGVGWVHYFGLG